MNKISFIIIIVFCFYQSIGQEVRKEGLVEAAEQRESLYVVEEHIEVLDFAAGGLSSARPCLGPLSSMFLFDNWEPGVTRLTDGTILHDRRYRYDIYNQQMQFIYENDTLAFANPEQISELTISKTEFIYTTYINEGLRQEGYFEVLAEGNYILLLRREIAYHITDAENEADAYIPNTEIYLQINGYPANVISLNKKAVLKALSDKREEIKTFLHENKLKIHTYDDLKKVVEYYNSIEL